MKKPRTQLGTEIGKIGIFLILLMAAIFPAKYINSIYGYLPFLIMLFFFLFSWLYFYILMKSIHLDGESLDTTCLRGENVNVTLKLVNKSILICPKARVLLSISDSFGGDDLMLAKDFILLGKSESEFPMDVKMNHIGIYQVGVKKMKLYDMMGFFPITFLENRNLTVTVLPRTYSPEDLILEEKLQMENYSLQKSTVSDGFDYTGVREYALGDSMKRIHWKLSAHSCSYMTKITETSRKSDVTIVIDFMMQSMERERLLSVSDCLIETALSIMEQTLMEEVECSLLFVGRDGEITRIMSKRKEDYETLIGFMPAPFTSAGKDAVDGAAILEEERHMSNLSSNLVLCTSRITEPLIQELINVKQQQRNPMLYCILPASITSHEIEGMKETLMTLDDYSICYHIMSAEEVS